MKQIMYGTLFLLIPVLLFSQVDNRPAATVRLIRSETITVQQLKTAVESSQRAIGRPLNRTEQRQLLDTMIDQKLVLQASERDRVTVTETEINQAIQQLRDNLAAQLGRQPTEPEFSSAIRSQTGLEIPAFREQIRQQMVIQKYVVAKKDALLRTYQDPTDSDILNAYNLTKSQFVRPDTIRLSMILVPIGSNQTEKNQARTVADRLQRDIGTSSSKFDEALLKAQSPSSGYQAGDMGYIPRTPEAQALYGSEFINTAFNLRQGEVSRRIETPAGYHIIKVTESYSQKALGLDDIIQLGTRVTVRQYIREGLAQERQQLLLDRAIQEVINDLRLGNPFQVYENNLTW
ncbi:MAG: peptidylprolyl isomerase [Treponema sp.]|jgi:parvulin-like peptidyl-prolyl isomerase|nr:peptidylprolyl isomerase [Treponema sp.]